MTEKICANCGTYQTCGFYCEECGQQLFPDIGKTIWNVQGKDLKICKEPKFNRWSGRRRRKPTK